MDPNTQGWLRRYCELRSTEVVESNDLPELDSEEILYRLLQPTGLMYGHPLQPPVESVMDFTGWDPVDKMKLIFSESLLHAGALKLQPYQEQGSSFTETTEHLVLEISDYFLNVYPQLYQGRYTSYLKDPYYFAENLIGKRLATKASLLKNYLANLFHNSLLFLDVFYFGQWVAGMGASSSRRIREEKEAMRLAILEVIALAAYADKNIQKEERALFEFFMQSADLRVEYQQQARGFLRERFNIEEIQIPTLSSWILKKYLLEIAVLTSLADKSMTSAEHQVIVQLGLKLGFSGEEIATSVLAVESFVLNNWSGMHYLMGRHHVETVGNRFVRRLKVFISKNKDYVVQEIRESKELVFLLGKSRTTGLTEIEKRIVSEQLMDILKTIPPIVIIALPFTFITLPIMLSLLPKSAFPSAFQE